MLNQSNKVKNYVTMGIITPLFAEPSKENRDEGHQIGKRENKFEMR